MPCVSSRCAPSFLPCSRQALLLLAHLCLFLLAFCIDQQIPRLDVTMHNTPRLQHHQALQHIKELKCADPPKNWRHPPETPEGTPSLGEGGDPSTWGRGRKSSERGQVFLPAGHSRHPYPSHCDLPWWRWVVMGTPSWVVGHSAGFCPLPDDPGFPPPASAQPSPSAQSCHPQVRRGAYLREVTVLPRPFPSCAEAFLLHSFPAAAFYMWRGEAERARASDQTPCAEVLVW